MHQWIWNNVGSGGFISFIFLPIQNISETDGVHIYSSSSSTYKHFKNA